MTNATTPGTATDASEGKPQATSWKGLNETLKDADGERHEFYPLSDVKDGETIELTLLGEAVFDKGKHHGKYSMVEMDVREGTIPFRLCVSGARLAKALSALEPTVGTTVLLTAKGPNGRERKWTATRKQIVAVSTLNGHA